MLSPSIRGETTYELRKRCLNSNDYNKCISTVKQKTDLNSRSTRIISSGPIEIEVIPYKKSR
ncbi:hypothetical protein [Prochlorococcus sp. MIT 1223]|uniref:hypothetical protein n=1 Tax=Prochlorococcus sp. MIT 1223 TaxID=3096217 RepID=UPI002A74A3B0|nr:hypothetical protein [Prochlorococcus sp. MIT 1223]